MSSKMAVETATAATAQDRAEMVLARARKLADENNLVLPEVLCEAYLSHAEKGCWHTTALGKTCGGDHGVPARDVNNFRWAVSSAFRVL